MTGLGENHVASQIELPTIGNTNNARLQHARFSGGIKGEEREGRSANPKRRERSRTKSWMQRSAQEKGVKTVQSSPCGIKRQWCQGRPEHIAPSYAWQNDVKASVY